MSNDYTPTTEQVQIMFVGRHEKFYGPLEKMRRGQFDRWLAAHDAEVAAKALEEAARNVQDYADSIDEFETIDDVYTSLSLIAAEIRKGAAS